jgi:tryptophan-rich sensory protein
MTPPQRLLQDGLIAMRSIPRLMIVTIKAIMNILIKIKNNRDKRHINLKANHIMVPYLWWIKIGTKQTKIKMENLTTLG